jgi:hypothetical protein
LTDQARRHIPDLQEQECYLQILILTLSQSFNRLDANFNASVFDRFFSVLNPQVTLNVTTFLVFIFASFVQPCIELLIQIYKSYFNNQTNKKYIFFNVATILQYTDNKALIFYLPDMKNSACFFAQLSSIIAPDLKMRDHIY